jgi:hypothetical protein
MLGLVFSIPSAFGVLVLGVRWLPISFSLFLMGNGKRRPLKSR